MFPARVPVRPNSEGSSLSLSLLAWPAVAPREKPRTAVPSGYFISTKVLKLNLRSSAWKGRLRIVLAPLACWRILTHLDASCRILPHLGARPGDEAQGIDHGAGLQQHVLDVLRAPSHLIDLPEEHRDSGGEEDDHRAGEPAHGERLPQGAWRDQRVPHNVHPGHWGDDRGRGQCVARDVARRIQGDLKGKTSRHVST